MKKFTDCFCPIVVAAIVFASIASASKIKRIVSIDLNAIKTIESNGNNKAVSSVGARGPYQIMNDTWDYTTDKMDVDWSFDDAFDESKSRKVADYYINIEIPRVLKHHQIPDTVDTRLAAYNCGYGNYYKNGKVRKWGVETAWRKYKNNWMKHVPGETVKYIERYHEIVGG